MGRFGVSLGRTGPIGAAIASAVPAVAKGGGVSQQLVFIHQAIIIDID
jgi:hypothetical protein